jgi:hypothetical protein
MRLFILIISILIPSALTFAQSEEANNLPLLNGHYFVPVSSLPAPFIKSHFGMSLGIASAKDFENILLEIDDEIIIGSKGSLIFADLNFDYQQKIKDWIAFYAKVGITARVVTELQSLLAQGVNTVTSFKMGWLIKIAKGEKYLLSGNIQINNNTANFINVKGFVDDIINNAPKPSISRNVPILSGGIGLRYAYGFNDLFGLQAFGGIAYGESYERGVSDFTHRIGGSFDANLANRTKVPMGFALFYSSSSLPELVQVKGKSATNGGIKISYTGAPHFNMGLELSQIRVPIPNVEEKVNSKSILITTKYYFN